VAAHPAWAQGNAADREQEIEMTLDHYTDAHTQDQRTAAVDYLKQFDHKLVANAVIDHIIASRDGVEATAFDKLIEDLNPDGGAAVIDRIPKTGDAVAKGKLVVALRHCEGDDCIRILTACLDDKRPVPFAAHGPNPRRVCDLAYDELFLKLRSNAYYELDPTPRMKGVITERTPTEDRDVLIERLKAKLATAASPAPSPAPSATPEAPVPPAPPAPSQQ